MLKMPSMSSKKLESLLERGGAVLARQSRTDHAIYIKGSGREKILSASIDGKENAGSRLLQESVATTQIHR
jgi:hypothetical protein